MRGSTEERSTVDTMSEPSQARRLSRLSEPALTALFEPALMAFLLVVATVVAPRSEEKV